MRMFIKLRSRMKKNLIVVLCLFVFACGLTFLSCAKKDQKREYISIWHWMTDRDEVFQELAKRYQEKTGIEVRIDLYAPSDVYTQKVIASAQAKVLPDIFGILDKKKVFASYIKNGFIADLTSVFKANNSKWEKKFFKKALGVNIFGEDNSYGVPAGIYGVPLDISNIQMVYNKELLAKAGYNDYPKTFNELLEVIATLKRIGIVGFVAGWGERWIAECFASNYAFNVMGEEKVMATIRGEVKYTDPDWIKVFDVFKQLRDSGGLMDGIVSKRNKYAEQDFAHGRAAFAFNGSWCVNVYRDMNPNLNYSPMLPPAISTKWPMRIWGGAGSSFVVNERSVNKEKAIAFLQWLTDDEQQEYLASETKNLPSNRNALSSIDPILAEFANSAEYTTHPNIWEYNENDKVLEAFDKGIQSIIIGDKTPEQVAGEVQALKDKILEREERRKRK